MLFFLILILKNKHYIFILLISIIVAVACTGTKKYFKAAERLEKQGLVNEAAEYYLESLKRKPTNVEARIKLKNVGQKYMSNLASEFFRNYNTQQLEASLETYEKLKEFDNSTSALDVRLDYPKTYDEDYQKAVTTFCEKNYDKAHLLVNQKKYGEATIYLARVQKYNSTYKNTKQLDVIATCEPIYQNAINSMEAKNYSAALNLLETIKAKSEDYKDSKDLLELATAKQTKSFILFEPSPSGDNSEKNVETELYYNFSQTAQQRFSSPKIINNILFENNSGRVPDLNKTDNIDLIQAIRKVTGADYFYVFDVTNKREFNSGINKTSQRGYQEVKTKKNDTLIITEYKAFDYNLVKAQRAYNFEFKYKIIDAYTNQVIASQTQSLRSQDAVEYQEFLRNFNGNINTLFPYNPQQTAPAAQYNPRGWRNLFSARNDLKLMDDLKKDVFNQTINLFVKSASAMK